MIVDSSALVAVATREPRYRELVEALTTSRLTAVGAPTLVETGMVLTSRMDARGRAALEALLTVHDIAVITFDAEHWREAVTAFSRYGKGRHPAGLNFGDCLTYATARRSGRPLLCLGDDFAQTDLEVVPLG